MRGIVARIPFHLAVFLCLLLGLAVWTLSVCSLTAFAGEADIRADGFGVHLDENRDDPITSVSWGKVAANIS